MRRWLLLAPLVALAGCAGGGHAARPVAVYPGVPWFGAPPPADVATVPAGPWTAPAPTPQPQTSTGERPTLVGAALSGVGILLGPATSLPSAVPQTLPLPGGLALPWPWPSPAPSATGGVPPASDGWPASWSAFEQEVLVRTNQERQRGAVCAGEPFAPVQPLAFDPALTLAARRHSQDMAQRDYFEHETPEGVGPLARASAAGSRARLVGENIAAGQVDPARVVKAWMDSPGHCRNLMDAQYRTLGVGYFFEESDRFGHYWTQDFGG